MTTASGDKKTNIPLCWRTKKFWGAFLGIGLCLICSFLPVPEGLSKQGLLCLSTLLGAVIFMIFQVLPEYWIALALNALWALLGIVKFDVAFKAFSNPAWWILLAALAIGVAVSQTGLLKRIALIVLTVFPATFRGQVLGMLCSSLVVNPFIPSTTVKVAVSAPFSRAISDAMGYPAKSPAAEGMFCAMFMGFSQFSLAFLSANVQAYLLFGFLPASVQAQLTWLTWFIGMLPWLVIMVAGTYFFIIFAYKPEKESNITSTYVRDELKAMGPMDRNQKITLIVLCCALLFWSTGSLHKISATLVALIALLVLLLLQVLSTKDFRSNFPWDNIFFLGGVLSIGIVFADLKIDKWMQQIINPYFSGLTGNLFALFAAVMLGIVTLRFIMVSMNSTMIIFGTILVPLCMGVNLNPWPIMMAVFCGSNVWLVFYQNAVYLTGYYAAGGDMVRHSATIKMCVVYLLLALAAFMISVPYWDKLGLLRL
ncbi:MAG: anion permease [Desulfovibrio sp.]|jgi:DASS family divalent anion:Na+ symporter|nr:anion permease [Desulfovibrio sp.]